MASKRLTADEIADVIGRLDRVLDGVVCVRSPQYRETLLRVDAVLCRAHNALMVREHRHRLWVQAARRKGGANGTT